MLITSLLVLSCSMVGGCGGSAGEDAATSFDAQAQGAPKSPSSDPLPTTSGLVVAGADVSTSPPAISSSASESPGSSLPVTSPNAALPVAAVSQASAPSQQQPATATSALPSTPPVQVADAGPSAAVQSSSPPPVGAPAPTPSPPPSPAPTPSTGEMRWSDPQTWGGVLPGRGAEVVIPAGKTIVLDTATASLGAVHVNGTLTFADADVALTAASIDVTGSLLVGTASAPFRKHATITLTGAPTGTDDSTYSRGLLVRGGRLELYGVAPSPAWTLLGDHAAKGANAMTLKDSVNWSAGDIVAVSPTDFYQQAATERLTLASAASTTRITTTTGLAASRWGKLQYPTANGMSLMPDPSYAPPATPAPTELDERATVVNLTRNIVIQGADDTYWNLKGFGANVMIMDLKSKVVVDGVEMRRVGQAGIVGRYPFHWHMLSYGPGDGSLLGDATGHVLRNSAIWDSANRCVVLHGTNGVKVINNICEDVKGHAFFMEDGVERRNVLDGNVALMVRAPAPGVTLLNHESLLVNSGGPSGFWLTNPDNTIVNNRAGDSAGLGFWLAYPTVPQGLSARVPLKPIFMKHGLFQYNTAFSTRLTGIQLDLGPVDAQGHVASHGYAPTVDGSPWDFKNGVRFELKRNAVFKGGDGAYRNRVTTPDYLEWTVADNVGVFFAGVASDGQIARALLVGTSLNSGTPYPKSAVPPAGFASYHSSLSMKDNTLINFPFVEGANSGAWANWDYYLRAVEKGTERNTNNLLIKTSPGYRTPPPAMDPKARSNEHWALAGAMWDPNGYEGPKGNWWVYDVPFLTEGANCQWVEPQGKNGKSCDGQYFGVYAFQTDFDPSRFLFMSPIEVTRLNESGQTIGTWSVGDGKTSWKLQNMRHFAARPNGRYALRFPDRPLPKWVAMTVTNAQRVGDSFILGVAFDGSQAATGYTVAGNQYGRERWKTSTATPAEAKSLRYFKPASSYAEVVAGSGDRMWQDRANNMVWIKYAGGINPEFDDTNPPGYNEAAWYHFYSLLIYAK